MLDWVIPIHRKSRYNLIAHYVSRTLILLLLIFLSAFYTVQLFLGLAKKDTVVKIIPIIMWFLTYPGSIYVFLLYNSRRRQLLSFFGKSSQLECRLKKKIIDIGSPFRAKRLAIFMYTCYALMTSGLLQSLYNMMVNQPENEILLSHYKLVRDSITVHLLLFVHLTGIAIVWILYYLSDIVPSLIFYCAGAALKSIEMELIDLFANLGFAGKSWNTQAVHLNTDAQINYRYQSSSFCLNLREIWFKYETLSDLVQVGNQIFGFLMVFVHGVMFFLTCALCFLFLTSFKDSSIDRISFFLGLICFIFRFVSSIYLPAQLYNSYRQLSATLSSLLSQYCDQLSKPERDTLVLFIDRLYTNVLAARPLALYTIQPSLMLSILSLGISYVIVLAQLK